MEIGTPPRVWDAHVCLPLYGNGDLAAIHRHKQAGFTDISVNLGMDWNTRAEIDATAAQFSQWFRSTAGYSLIADIDLSTNDASRHDVVVAFDMEGISAFEGDLSRVQEYVELGVRQVQLTYNLDNEAGSGCLGLNTGLTNFGKEVVAELNAHGVVVDCSHASYQTALDIIDVSAKPVIFSHSNCLSLFEHPRNIPDELIVACAEKGGVIGINGIGKFVGAGDLSVKEFCAHILHVVQLAGDEHVGLGLDYVYDLEEMRQIFIDRPDIFPGADPDQQTEFVPPEQLSEIRQELESLGMDSGSIKKILGENFARVASKN